MASPSRVMRLARSNPHLPLRPPAVEQGTAVAAPEIVAGSSARARRHMRLTALAAASNLESTPNEKAGALTACSHLQAVTNSALASELAAASSARSQPGATTPSARPLKKTVSQEAPRAQCSALPPRQRRALPRAQASDPQRAIAPSRSAAGVALRVRLILRQPVRAERLRASNASRQELHALRQPGCAPGHR